MCIRDRLRTGPGSRGEWPSSPQQGGPSSRSSKLSRGTSWLRGSGAPRAGSPRPRPSTFPCGLSGRGARSSNVARDAHVWSWSLVSSAAHMRAHDHARGHCAT
eukprot:7004430-Alexandrium_andersonii.AAC.1